MYRVFRLVLDKEWWRSEGAYLPVSTTLSLSRNACMLHLHLPTRGLTPLNECSLTALPNPLSLPLPSFQLQEVVYRKPDRVNVRSIWFRFKRGEWLVNHLCAVRLLHCRWLCCRQITMLNNLSWSRAETVLRSSARCFLSPPGTDWGGTHTHTHTHTSTPVRLLEEHTHTHPSFWTCGYPHL